MGRDLAPTREQDGKKDLAHTDTTRAADVRVTTAPRSHHIRDISDMPIVSVCPAETVEAPVDIVWGLLTAPAMYGRFWDLHVESVEPPGAAATGQRISGWTREVCRRWPIEGEIVSVDTTRHQIRFRMSLPFGVTSDNLISCTPIDAAQCLVRFG